METPLGWKWCLSQADGLLSLSLTLSLPFLFRVEGKGAATILDVIYQTTEEKQKEVVEAGAECGEDVYKAVMATVREKEKEVKQLQFRQGVLLKQELLLKTFAEQVCHVHLEKVWQAAKM